MLITLPKVEIYFLGIVSVAGEIEGLEAVIQTRSMVYDSSGLVWVAHSSKSLLLLAIPKLGTPLEMTV